MSAFGFTESSAPVPGVAVLRTGNTNICLLEKRMGTRASTHSEETRRTSATGRLCISTFRRS